MSQKTAGVILNGCGHRDGSEVHEAVFTLLALDQHGIEANCYALEEDQKKVFDHINSSEQPETRSMIVESARIARGAIKPLSQCSVDQIDMLVIPGGSGGAFNLCNYAEAGSEMSVHAEIATVITEVFSKKKKWPFWTKKKKEKKT